MKDAIMQELIDVRVAANGRMVLPRAVRNALGVANSGILVLSVDGDEVKMISMRESIRRAQALYREHVTNDQTSANFLEARRLEARQDQATDEQI
jgi:bifunctional DNA-binding transcriptional regulator/antitoxin component of YhaV-PrlF toxin-antitoxin module